MGTFFKYLIYLLVIIVLYLVIKGCYDGSINSQTTVGNVASQVSQGTQEMATNAANVVENMVDGTKQARQHQ
ncbi:MAG: hypothetical protein E7020_00325 [Alphaproteobacteria bacterium]|nr:hypothetical protein [Alphaproteobacteria bacterium]